MSRSILDERMVPGLVDGFFTSRITIEAHDGTSVDAHNQKLESGWANLSGHVDIPCAVWPATAVERRTTTDTVSRITKAALMAGSFPAVTAENRADVGGVKYNVHPPEMPSQGSTTKVLLELVTT